jgi:prevent-host-death family protein
MTTLSVSAAKARLNELARLAHAQHERFTLTRNGRAEAVLLSVDDKDSSATIDLFGSELQEVVVGLVEAVEVLVELSKQLGRLGTGQTLGGHD